MMLWLIGVLLGLPFSVWLLAALCALIDEPEPVPAMVRLSLGICGMLVLLLLTDADLLYPVLASFFLIVVLHVGGFFLVREFGTGVPVYERTPPRPPLLDEEVNQLSAKESDQESVKDD